MTVADLNKIDLSLTINNIHGDPILEINSYGDIDFMADYFDDEVKSLLKNIEPTTPFGIQEYVVLNAMAKLFGVENVEI